jgi:hypothetical protein
MSGNWAVTGSAAAWLLGLDKEKKFRDPHDVDILVDNDGMMNAHFILTNTMGLKDKKPGYPGPQTMVRTLEGKDGTKVDLINVSRFKVAIDFSTDVTSVMSIPVLKMEKLLAFEAKRYAS